MRNLSQDRQCHDGISHIPNTTLPKWACDQNAVISITLILFIIVTIHEVINIYHNPPWICNVQICRFFSRAGNVGSVLNTDHT